MFAVITNAVIKRVHCIKVRGVNWFVLLFPAYWNSSKAENSYSFYYERFY